MSPSQQVKLQAGNEYMECLNGSLCHYTVVKSTFQVIFAINEAKVHVIPLQKIILIVKTVIDYKNTEYHTEERNR